MLASVKPIQCQQTSDEVMSLLQVAKGMEIQRVVCSVFVFDFVVVISNFVVIFIGVYVSFDVFARFDEICQWDL